MVLCTGCFNVIHAGHIELFEFASRYSDTGKIDVGINGESYIKKKYGDKAVPLLNRVRVVSAIKYVDRVHIFNEENPSKLIRRLAPDYFVRGPDYAGQDIPESYALCDVGAQLIIHRANKIGNASELVQALTQGVFEESVFLGLPERSVHLQSSEKSPTDVHSIHL